MRDHNVFIYLYRLLTNNLLNFIDSSSLSRCLSSGNVKIHSSSGSCAIGRLKLSNLTVGVASGEFEPSVRCLESDTADWSRFENSRNRLFRVVRFSSDRLQHAYSMFRTLDARRWVTRMKSFMPAIKRELRPSTFESVVNERVCIERISRKKTRRCPKLWWHKCVSILGPSFFRTRARINDSAWKDCEYIVKTHKPS